ncbi:MAG TPA: TonB family protein [Noviherbaspirillum sp.]|jgi:protein TonB|uniref:energy transducer TonB family protein n=1 Tax=Noviherbaspirillum sp. TaxID=1926288 RepID=UPI002DDCB4C9|nr:TonB family protein [Noviherbaspirillum sp.]HEV2609348.1 TonB family protein [Noviherbaspirillum sp.]
MYNRIAIIFLGGVLAACGTSTDDRLTGQSKQELREPSGRVEPVETTPDATSTASTVDGYKRDIAQRIVQVNSTQVFIGRPQALLRSVVVVRYAVDARGNLVHSEIQRSNRDKVTEATALATLRNSAPFPKPASNLLRRGRVEISETWLFNNDGRFQLRTIAEPQMDR